MTDRERQVLDIIKRNPTIDQNGIAQILGITRTTVAAHIASLEKQGILLGRGYLLKANDHVVGIGAANVDIYGKSLIKMRPHYDHPSIIETTVGGVTRNILENVSRLGLDAKLITAVGNDHYGRFVLDHSIKAGIDCDNILRVEGGNTGVFMQIMDDNNDMHLAMCDMSINANLTRDFVAGKERILRSANAIVIDPSLSEYVIDYVLSLEGANIYIDPVSDNYAEKIRPYIGRFYLAKPNASEMAVLADMKIESEEDLIAAGRKLIDSGLKHLYVSLGAEGCLYMNYLGNCFRKKLKPLAKIVNASGAGDSFMGALIYAHVNHLDMNRTLDLALAAGKASLMHTQTINPEMSIGLLDKILKGE